MTKKKIDTLSKHLTKGIIEIRKYSKLRKSKKIPFLLIKNFNNVRITTLSDITPFTFLRLKEANKYMKQRYKEIYGVATDDDANEIIKIEKKISKLYEKLRLAKLEAWKNKKEMKITDLQLIYKKLDKIRYKKYLNED